MYNKNPKQQNKAPQKPQPPPSTPLTTVVSRFAAETASCNTTSTFAILNCHVLHAKFVKHPAQEGDCGLMMGGWVWVWFDDGGGIVVWIWI